jgi:hypothetical protein
MADGWCASFSHEANDAYIYYHLDIQFDGAMDDVPVITKSSPDPT